MKKSPVSICHFKCPYQDIIQMRLSTLLFTRSLYMHLWIWSMSGKKVLLMFTGSDSRCSLAHTDDLVVYLIRDQMNATTV